jgi:hypothetical protein
MEPHTAQLTALAERATLIIEFGVRGAVSTWALLDGLPADGRLIGVDIIPDRDWYDRNQPEWTGYATPIPPRVRRDPRFSFVHGNSIDVDLPEHADLIVIDSSHDYHQTVAELARAAKLTPAVIALHDYLYSETPDVRRAVDEFVADRAIADGAYVGSAYRLDVVHPSKWGLAVLRRR